MRRATIWLSGLLAVAWVAAYTAAEEGEGGGAPKVVKKEGGEQREGPRKEGAAALRGDYGRMAEVCALTEDQKKAIAGLQEACEKEIRDVQAKYQTQILDVFTAEQKAKWNETILLGNLKRIYEKANLTEEQLTRIKAAIAAQTKAGEMVAAEPAKGGGMIAADRGGGEALRKLSQFVSKEVLTNDQKAALWDAQHQEGEGRREGEVRKEGER